MHYFCARHVKANHIITIIKYLVTHQWMLNNYKKEMNIFNLFSAFMKDNKCYCTSSSHNLSI